MKRHTLILTAVTVLALAAISCGIQFAGANPTPMPQGPIPQNINNPVPQMPGPQNGDPGPQELVNGNPQNPVPQPIPQNGNPIPQGPGPNPNNGNPGEGDIMSFTADSTTLNKGQCTMLHWETRGNFGAKLNGQPVALVGQQQECPTQTTVYELGLDVGNQTLRRQITITVNGGNQSGGGNNSNGGNKSGGGNNSGGNPPVITKTPQFSIVPGEVANTNLSLVNIFVRPGDGHVMATFRNSGNINLNTTTTLKCANGKGNGALVSTKTVTLNLKPGEIFNQDTGWTRTTAGGTTLGCSFTPPSGDTHPKDDSMDAAIPAK